MTLTVPLADIEREADRLTTAFAERGLTVRLIGGLAVAGHRHRDVPEPLRRSYGDIDLVIDPRQSKPFKEAMVGLGYAPNVRFNNLRGDRRMMFTDQCNGRSLDVFVGRFQMCHDLDLTERLGLHPVTLAPADLLLTKLQVVEINAKDLTDALTILLTHDVAAPDAAGEDDHISSDRLVAVTGTDWGWYTTFTDNLSRLSGLAVEILDVADADAVTGRASEILELLAAAPKSLRWRTRNMLGRRVSWYELPEETGGAINARK
jgi:hypothetical protein